MIGLLGAVMIVAAQFTMHNEFPWAAPVRAALVFVLAAAGAWLARRTITGLATWAVLGLLTAFVASDVYHNPGLGLSTWLIYAGVFALQRALQLDVARPLAVVGAVLTVLAPFELALGVNANVIGGTLLACLAAAIDRHGLISITALAVCMGIVMSGSRGALVGAFAVINLLLAPWALVAVPAVAGVLFAVRPATALLRLGYWRAALDVLRANWVMGVGPGRLVLPGLDGRAGWEIHAHNSLLTIAAQVGALGIAAIVAAIAYGLAFSGEGARPVRWHRWQLATLCGVGLHALCDDPLAWLPVGVIVALTLASHQEEVA